jgi:hypothetical protein
VIHCGSLTRFRDWIGAQTGMRSVPPDETPVPMFAGVLVRETGALEPNQVLFMWNGLPIRMFTLDD